ncbi:MAG TPA: sigma-70 family RNA polymerase sigma factor [Bacteroidales bacterium]|jgi:RNA polymerase sigma-70 factor (ECF subfamily)|nr:sigma-70 family RNA polymerase sigma factor [Bacteroidales bacterium]MCZ2416440.1 sigma-70 family RNA polymerase sigma factor [Burkholderiales bacterium]OQC56403.1 MAG: ECF RNA polymerase sigma factor SigJ [Bacteroidetes bacterium ADurb.Bin013]MBV6456878.1 ECF RNA polymerase sigma factor SigJ [Bacteroidales bacterium]MCZ2316707.1 sigma-70 family RNA polymerase sigma factor [Bacteroidales bacterium]
MFDAQTFKDTFLPWHGHLYRTAYRLLNCQADAEDTVQDVFVKLWNMRENLSGIKNLQAYATTMTRNLCLDRMRSSVYRNSDNSAAESLRYEWIDAVEQIDQQDELKMVLVLVDQLPQKQREIFRMRHFNELSLEEIRQLTGLSPVNIRVQLSRAQKKVKEQYERINCHGNR